MKLKTIILSTLTLITCLRADTIFDVSPESSDDRVARLLLQTPKLMRDSNLAYLESATTQLHDADNPQAVLDKLGTTAAALFTSNEEFMQFLQTFLTAKNDTDGLARLQAIQEKILSYTKNQDGTVTINNQVLNLGKRSILFARTVSGSFSTAEGTYYPKFLLPTFLAPASELQPQP